MTGHRQSRTSNVETRKYDEVIAAEPPRITWERDKRGVMRAVEVHDPHAETPNKPKGATA